MPKKLPRVYLFAQKPIGLQILLELHKLVLGNTIDIRCVISNSEPLGWWNNNYIYQKAEELGYSVIDNLNSDELSEFLKASPYSEDTWLISIQNPFKFSQKYLDKFGGRNMNLHLSPLPKYRGWNGFSHAILNGDTTYGWTIHQMNGDLDKGKIYYKSEFKIPVNATAKSLYNLSVEDLSNKFKDVFLNVLEGSLSPGEEIVSNEYYSSNSLDKHREIESYSELSENDISRIARALHFPPYEPLKFEINQNNYFIIPECNCC